MREVNEKGIPLKILDVCLWISRGYNISNACTEAHLSERDFWDLMSINKEIESMYIQAREARAHTRFEEMIATVDEVKQGKLDPHAGRVVLDAVKWMMGKEKARVYGDAMTLKGDKDNPIEIGLATALEGISGRRAPALERPREVIDLQPIRANASDYI